jgi:nicotinate-nucleotide pyrophosphorylase
MLLVKDNHLKVARMQDLKQSKRRYVLEVEVKNLKELKEALAIAPEMIMLDNMRIADMRKAVKLRDKICGVHEHLRVAHIEPESAVTLVFAGMLFDAQISDVEIQFRMKPLHDTQ